MGGNKKRWNNRSRGGGGGRGGRGRGKSDQQQGGPREDRWFSGEPNPDFVRFYKEQGIVPEGEWDDFIATLLRELPVTFRVSVIQGCRDSLLQQLSGDCLGLARPAGETIRVTCPERAGVVSEYQVPPPTPLHWYPDGCAWYFPTGRRVVRKSPDLRRFHNFLVKHDGNGQIVRQEAVSMIPPLFLDVQPHHNVLDMCAAPGSKTSQLLEALYLQRDAQGGLRSMLDGCSRDFPTGIIVANDADDRRAQMLAHRIKPLGSPNFLVVNHEGQCFPKILVPGSGGRKSQSLLFDRILCDVPCTGDGTLRKNPTIWADWHNGRGASLHALQLVIAQRGAQLLKPGGQMVYSTCSLCPYENEAVVAALLEACPELELVDVSDRLPGLRRMPGLLSWKVFAKDWSEMASPEAEQNQALKWTPSFWPPSPERAQAMNLQRCVRVLPHHQDTGGFFIVLLRRRALPAEVAAPVGAEEEEEEEAEEAEEALKDDEKRQAAAQPEAPAGQPQEEKPMRRGGGGYNLPSEDDLRPLAEADRQRLLDFYGLEGLDAGCLWTRGQQGYKVYYVPPLVKQILEHPRNARMKIIGSGIRVFESSRGGSQSVVDEIPRLVQEGAHLMQPFLTRQRVETGCSLFMRLLDAKPIPVAAAVPPKAASAEQQASPAEEDEGKEPPAQRPRLAPHIQEDLLEAEDQPKQQQRQGRSKPQQRPAGINKIAQNLLAEELESEFPEFVLAIRQQKPGSVLVELKDERAATLSTRPFTMAVRWTGRKITCMMSVIERQSMYGVLTDGDEEVAMSDDAEQDALLEVQDSNKVVVPSKRPREP